MNHEGKQPILVLNARCPQYIEILKKELADTGFWAFQSFDLQSTRALHEGCSCPHHGTSACTCELVVLLVSQAASDPITLVADGRDQQTFVYLLEEDAPPAFVAGITRAVQRSADEISRSGVAIDAG